MITSKDFVKIACSFAVALCLLASARAEQVPQQALPETQARAYWRTPERLRIEWRADPARYATCFWRKPQGFLEANFVGCTVVSDPDGDGIAVVEMPWCALDCDALAKPNTGDEWVIADYVLDTAGASFPSNRTYVKANDLERFRRYFPIGVMSND